MISLTLLATVVATQGLTIGEDARGEFISDGNHRVYAFPGESLGSVSTATGIFKETKEHSFLVKIGSTSRTYTREHITSALAASRKLLITKIDSSKVQYWLSGKPVQVGGGWTAVVSWYPVAPTAGDQLVQDILYLPVARSAKPRIVGKLMEGEVATPNFLRVGKRYYAFSHYWRKGMRLRTYTLDETNAIGKTMRRLLTWPNTLEGSTAVESVADRWIVLIREVERCGGDFYVFDTVSRTSWRVPIQPAPRSFFCMPRFRVKAIDNAIVAVADEAAGYKPQWILNLQTRRLVKVQNPSQNNGTIQIIWKGKAFDFQTSGSGNAQMYCRIFDVRTGKMVGKLVRP